MKRVDFRAVPPAPVGLRIGLFGGTFDPAHPGHRHVAETAAKRLGLAKVWWLVSPQNPLKARRASPLKERMASARAQARGRRHVVTDLEARLGLRFTAETLDAIRRLRPEARFYWIMGADNLEGFHRWRRWRDIAAAAPIVIVPRPGARLRGEAFARLATYRRPPSARLVAPAWTILRARLRPERSTDLRARPATVAQ